jgi:hypothetical protein
MFKVILLLLVLIQATAFTPPRLAAVQLKQRRAQITPLLLASSSKDDEIAQLEEKLRQLKEDDNVVVVVDDDAAVNTPNRMDEPMMEMLSESWRESDPSQSDEGGGFLLPLVGAILAVVVFVGFSQVPVGQDDLIKYSAIKTSSQIDLGDLNEAQNKAIQGL